ncbi:uncharacterized protein [Nicotiana sylvestris]|uniref:uncharacterized protein n=1 Tax=Nicotiana sylvestris TaxID=4096 RepID=UPI00388CDC68
MVAAIMMRQGYEPGKGLGASLQGISEPISPFGNRDTFGLGFRLTQADKNKAKHHKKHGWVLQQPIPHIFYTFVKPRLQEGCNPNISVFVNVGFNNMTCMRNSRPDLKKLSNIEIMYQEVEYDEDEVVEEIKRELEQFENKPKPNLNETEPINIGSFEEIREMKISIHTEQKTRDALIQLLFEYRDVFAWSYDDMSGLSVDLVVHELPTYPDFPPVQQKQRKFKTGVSDKIKEEIMKQLNANVIRAVRYTTWVANVVPVPKKDGKTRVCVDYRDLNKANNCAKHEIQSFVDCYAGYHQILMNEDDAEKTAFTTPWGTYCYRVMPLGLKNAGATYMRAMTTIFHDMMHKEIAVYVDDVIIKSKTHADHVCDLKSSSNGLEDHFAENPVDDEYRPLTTYFPDEEVNSIEEVVSDDHPVWKMYFDGAVNIKGVGIGAILISPIGHHYPAIARLRFFCTNNTAEYEACIMGLKMAIDLDVHELLVMGDSDLIIRQAQGNTHVDPLEIQVRNHHGYCNTIETEPDGETWYHDIKRFLKTREYPEHAKGDQKRTIRRLANGFFLNGEILYKRTPDLNLLRCIGATEAEWIMS